uniref:Uncharacterized protein n=1 Tax=Meloidogyne javanica TaxID=6303 RepID=A0A915N8K2_MELJA
MSFIFPLCPNLLKIFIIVLYFLCFVKIVYGGGRDKHLWHDPNEATHTSEDEASDKTLNLFPIHGDNQGAYASEPIRDWDEMRDQHAALYQYYLNQQQEFDANYSSNPTEYGTSTQIGTSGHGENISNPVHDSAHYAKLYKDSQAEGKGFLNIEPKKSKARKARTQQGVTHYQPDQANLTHHTSQHEVDQNAIMQMYQRGMQKGNDYIPNFDLGKYEKQEDSD